MVWSPWLREFGSSSNGIPSGDWHVSTDSHLEIYMLIFWLRGAFRPYILLQQVGWGLFLFNIDIILLIIYWNYYRPQVNHKRNALRNVEYSIGWTLTDTCRPVLMTSVPLHHCCCRHRDIFGYTVNRLVQQLLSPPTLSIHYREGMCCHWVL